MYYHDDSRSCSLVEKSPAQKEIVQDKTRRYFPKYRRGGGMSSNGQEGNLISY